MGRRVWKRAYNRWEYVWGGYWSNFSFSIILIILFAFILVILCFYVSRKTYQYNVKILKALLIVCAFFIMMFGICLIIFIAG